MVVNGIWETVILNSYATPHTTNAPWARGHDRTGLDVSPADTIGIKG